MEDITLLFLDKLKDLNFKSEVKTIYLRSAQFPAEVIWTPRVLFEFSKGWDFEFDAMMPSTKLYYIFFVLRTVIFGKYMVKRESESITNYNKRLKVLSSDEVTNEEPLTEADKFFNITKDEYLFFLKYFNVYKADAAFALAHTDGNAYIKANEAFLIRMIMLLKKKHDDLDAHSDVSAMCFGAEIAQLNAPVLINDEQREEYFKALTKLNKLQAECNEANAEITKFKLRSNLGKRYIWKDDETTETTAEMENVKELTEKDGDDFIIL
jgi:hypothetical protein